MTKQFKLPAAEMQRNFSEFNSLIDKYFPTRAKRIHLMNTEIGHERLMFLPAAPSINHHNCFPGGYIDHVLRVMKFASKEYVHAKDIGIDVSGFTPEELMFAAMHHDLGKVGFIGEGKDGYVANDSKWHRDKLGMMYKVNENIPYATVPDKSLFLLQSFGVQCSFNEHMSIRIHDGLYDKANESYYFSNQMKSKFRNFMPVILHFADMYAARFELERWNKVTGALKTERLEDIDLSNFDAALKPSPTTKKKEDLVGAFNDVFK